MSRPLRTRIEELEEFTHKLQKSINRTLTRITAAERKIKILKSQEEIESAATTEALAHAH